MKYIKKYNEELHLNPLQMGKVKWDMPGGLSMYTKSEETNYRFKEDFNKLILNNYFKNKVTKISKYLFNSDKFKNVLLDFGHNVTYIDVEYNQNLSYFKLVTNWEKNEEISLQYLNILESFNQHYTDIENYIIVYNNFGLFNGKKKSVIKARLLTSFKCRPDSILRYAGLYDASGYHSTMKTYYYFNPVVDLYQGVDGVFQVDINGFKEVLKKANEKFKASNDKQDNRERAIKAVVELKKPIFKELQETLLDLSQGMIDIFGVDGVRIEKNEISNVGILNIKAKIDHNDLNQLSDIIKELKQIKVAMRMDFGDGVISDYVHHYYNLNLNGIGGIGVLTIYFDWQEKFKAKI